MQRRLFFAFGGAIAVTGLTVFVLMSVLGVGSNWNQQGQRIGRWVEGRFARVWDQPAARDDLARSISQDLDVGVRVHDVAGVTIATYGSDDRCRHPWVFRVRDASGPRGSVDVCMERRGFRIHRMILTLVIAGFVLWGLAGRFARRMTHPLMEVTRVANEIGAGNLASRARLPHGGTDEVAHLAESINDMASRIERQLKEQRELLAAVSHELRTPLARIRILLELARDGVDVKTQLDEIEREVVEIDGLVGDLLANARIDFESLQRRDVDAAETAHRAVERSGANGVKVAVEDDVGKISADPTLLVRAMVAMIDNARKHGGDVIELRVVRADRHAVFAVEDNGRGFAPGDEARVFEAFYRGRGTDEPGDGGVKGIGMGLSLVKRIAEAHQGRAWAENREGGGARVAIALPV